MKSSKLYTTFEEIKLREELKKKYNVQEHKLTGHIPSRLYPPPLHKKEMVPSKKD